MLGEMLGLGMVVEKAVYVLEMSGSGILHHDTVSPVSGPSHAGGGSVIRGEIHECICAMRGFWDSLG